MYDIVGLLSIVWSVKVSYRYILYAYRGHNEEHQYLTASCSGFRTIRNL